MSYVLTEEQESIRRTAKALVGERAPVAHLRALRDEADKVGFSRELWKEMASLGLVGMAIPESYGGAGLGFAELGLVLYECGRTLAPTPFVATVLLGASALLSGGSPEQNRTMLPAVCAGDRIIALAHDERSRFLPYEITTRAEPDRSGFRLSGEKTFVIDGHVADDFIVVARSAGAPGDRAGLTLLVVPADAPGITVTRSHMVDSRNAARVRFAATPAREILGQPGAGADVLDAALDRATAGLCAEMLGGIEEVFERTIAYLKTRRQFGVPIGSFQALKHRAAYLFCEIELSKSIVLDALRAVDLSRPDLSAVVSVAKARASDTYLAVTNEAVQMHGGVGVTDELDIGLFLKRARVAEMTFGTASYHRNRYAELHGY
ncbi:MAG TPA: acyl-CoA dehydrogenase family protein [Polyangiaceae bacterium]|nr:acyl-CoA dehydrogenase family protein [Polyangiaceae bacterium]